MAMAVCCNACQGRPSSARGRQAPNAPARLACDARRRCYRDSLARRRGPRRDADSKVPPAHLLRLLGKVGVGRGHRFGSFFGHRRPASPRAGSMKMPQERPRGRGVPQRDRVRRGVRVRVRGSQGGARPGRARGGPEQGQEAAPHVPTAAAANEQKASSSAQTSTRETSHSVQVRFLRHVIGTSATTINCSRWPAMPARRAST
eukprot:510616-Prymnesium_polylepis.1